MVILLSAKAAPGVGQVLEGPEGPVEVIGLERWTARGLLEAIQRTAPGQPLHACAATRKFELGFADAAVFGWIDAESPEDLRSGDLARYTVIIGIEDGGRVRYRTPGTETIVLPRSWRALKSVAEEDLRTLQLATGMFRLRDDPESLRQRTEMFGLDTTGLSRVWTIIEALNREDDRRLAHAILARDASWSSRAIAASVLVNFSEHDSAWHDLMSAMIDPEDRVKGSAQGVLQAWMQAGDSRPVRWDAARDHLLAVLDGTSPYMFRTVLDVLAATGETTLVKQLIREAPDLLLAHVGARHEITRQPAINLLKAVSGEDFGADPEGWAEWLDRSPDDSRRVARSVWTIPDEPLGPPDSRRVG